MTAAMALPLPETVGGWIKYARWNLRHISQRVLAERTGGLVSEPVIMRLDYER